MDRQQFLQDVLNSSGVREALRRYVPQIDRLESLDSLAALELTGMHIGWTVLDGCFADINYQAIASGDVYPYVRTKLIEKGVIGQHNVVHTTRCFSGSPIEYEELHLVFVGKQIQVFLTVYNPNYNPL